MERKAIWFNKDEIRLYRVLKKKGMISQNFQGFVRTAYHQRIDELRAKLSGIDLSKATIAKKTSNVLQKLSVKKRGGKVGKKS